MFSGVAAPLQVGYRAGLGPRVFVFENLKGEAMDERNSVEIGNIGPIEGLSIPLPADGGVVVLRGSNGSGKSTALKAVAKALGGDGRGLSVRDGQKRGTVELAGAKLTVTRSRQAMSGDELEVESIESRIDISKLVDPGIKGLEEADTARVKALVRLAGVQADPSVYYELAGGESEFAALGVDVDTDDPVLLARRVKSAFDCRAKAIEREMEKKAAEVRILGAELEGFEPDPDGDYLSVETARDIHLEKCSVAVELKQRQDEAKAAKARADEAKKQLLELEASRPANSIVSVEQARATLETLVEKRAELRAALNEVVARISDANSAVDAAVERERQQAHFEFERKKLSESIDAIMPDCPADEEIEQAKADVMIAQESIVQAQAFEDKRAMLERFVSGSKLAKQLKKQAANLRDNGRATSDILSRLIPMGDLRYEAGRLVVRTDRSESEPYSDLSHGERWKLAIDIAVEYLPDGGLLVIPQESYEGLSNENRQLIDRHAKERGVVILTAAVSDSDGIVIDGEGSGDEHDSTAVGLPRSGDSSDA